MFLPPLIRSVRTAAAWETAEYSGEKKKKKKKKFGETIPPCRGDETNICIFFPTGAAALSFFFLFFLPLQLSGCRTQPRGGDIDGARVSPHFRTLHQKYFCLRRATRHLAGGVTAPRRGPFSHNPAALEVDRGDFGEDDALVVQTARVEP